MLEEQVVLECVAGVEGVGRAGVVGRGGAVEQLMAAALMGLFGVAGCAGDKNPDTNGEDSLVEESRGDTEESADTPSGTDSSDTGECEENSPEILSVETNTTIKFADFTAECLGRGGVVQTHAVCAGNNACQGFSFNKYSKEMMEHTCRGMNSCGGISCVVLPVDQGRSGEEIYNASCGGMCHGSPFTLFVHPSRDLEEARTRFLAKSREEILSILAFGARGMNDSGTAYANMPAFHEQFSRAEIERTIDYLKGLELEVDHYTIVGETEDLN